MKQVIKDLFSQEIREQRRLNSFLDLITLADGLKLVKKTTSLGTEGKMLTYLGKHLNCAKVYYFDKEMLLMEYIENRCSFDEKEAAFELARMHQIQFDYFGFEYDTAIGPHRQPNPKTESWVEFFKTHRVLYMAKECLKEGAIERRLFERVENLSQDLNHFIGEPPHPSLLHGDIWGGNVLCKDGKAAYIDPAIYYGHYEIELAFTTLFHTFSKKFYDEYANHLPLDREFFTVRKDIYNIYPLLVHIRSFGGNYVYELEEVLKRFGY